MVYRVVLNRLHDMIMRSATTELYTLVDMDRFDRRGQKNAVFTAFQRFVGFSEQFEA